MIARRFVLLAAAGLFAGACSEKKASESQPPPPVSGGEALTTDITASDIEQAAEEAKRSINAANAEAELEKLESEIDDGK